MAHSFPPSFRAYWIVPGIHIDDQEEFKKDAFTNDSVNLLKVALHEIGHILGFIHNNEPDSILYPIYRSPGEQEDIELPLYDRTIAKQYYGKCESTFNIVFDWLRKYPCSGMENCYYKYKYVFNTYFFKDELIWLYENHASRPRLGDPLDVRLAVFGVPFNMDAGVQILTANQTMWMGRNITEYFIQTLLFKRDLVYLYNDERNHVEHTYTIQDYFPTKEGESESIPNNIDAVYSDVRNDNLFFLKGDYVRSLKCYMAHDLLLAI